MAKSSKKNKQKKADFQKVKLKLGRKLPKGNVVDTTFKAKKILIREQLKPNDYTLTGKPKKDIKDYLNKLQHHSPVVRVEVVRNLKESLTEHPSLIHSQLHLLIERVSGLVTDVNEPVRKRGIDLLRLIFANIKAEQIVPFFPVIVAHVRCALTHIAYEVQSDGLTLVDLLVDMFPQHLKHFSRHLLQDFLNQISSQLEPTLRKPNNLNTNKRILASDPSRKVIGLKWYLGVCQRLKKVLKSILKSSNTSSNSNLKPPEQIVHWKNNKALYRPLYNIEMNRKTDTRCDHLKEFFDSADQLKCIISSLMPLMFAMWVETSSFSENDEKGTVTTEPLDMYVCTAEIIRLLWKIIERWQAEEHDSYLEEWFRKTFGKSFRERCLTRFPYTDLTKLGIGIKLRSRIVQMNIERLNVILCEVFCCTLSGDTLKPDHLSIARNYIMGIFEDEQNLARFHNVDSIVLIIKRLLKLDSLHENQKLIECMRAGLQKSPSNSKCYKKFLFLLSDIILLPDYCQVCRLPALVSWISQLPKDVAQLEVIPFKLLEIMTLVAPRRSSAFLDNLLEYFPKMLEKVPVLNVDCNEVLAAQRLLLNMLYWIPKVDVTLFAQLSKLCFDKDTNGILSAYVLEVLNSRYLRLDPSIWCNGCIHYVSFLFSLTLGVSKMELMQLNYATSPRESSRCHEILKFSRTHHILMGSKDHLPHYRKITQLGANAVLNLSIDSYADFCSEGFLRQVLNEFSYFPLRSAYALLHITGCTWHLKNLPPTLLPSLSCVALSFVEVLVTVEGMAKEFFQVVSELMTVQNLSEALCKMLVSLSSQCLTKETVNLLGEAGLLFIKTCTKPHTKILWSVLSTLKKYDEDYVSTSHWYVSGKYELFSQDCSLTDRE